MIEKKTVVSSSYNVFHQYGFIKYEENVFKIIIQFIDGDCYGNRCSTLFA